MLTISLRSPSASGDSVAPAGLGYSETTRSSRLLLVEERHVDRESSATSAGASVMQKSARNLTRRDTRFKLPALLSAEENGACRRMST